MSVIFGIKENNRIIIAGDKRGSSIDGKTLSDDLDKVLMINDHLAFSSAGNAAIEKAISIDLNKATNKDCLTTDDLLDIIKAFYKRVADTNCDAILALPFYFLIAGKGRDGNASLISGGNIKGRLDAKDVPMALFPPADAKMQECCDCFAKNYKLHNSEFVEKTIKEIANISNLVSPTGNKWIYNITTEKGMLVSWCADQCGYIESGIIPKFSGCVDGSNWFKGNGQWQDRNYEPQAGDIIFFDWEGDGETDHVGIVEKCENGVVYTVEGNSGDACRQNQYTVGSSSIYGYGVPAY